MDNLKATRLTLQQYQGGVMQMSENKKIFKNTVHVTLLPILRCLPGVLVKLRHLITT